MKAELKPTRSWKLRAKIKLEPRDLWVGVFWDIHSYVEAETSGDRSRTTNKKVVDICVCLLPMLLFHLTSILYTNTTPWEKKQRVHHRRKAMVPTKITRPPNNPSLPPPPDLSAIKERNWSIVDKAIEIAYNIEPKSLYDGLHTLPLGTTTKHCVDFRVPNSHIPNFALITHTFNGVPSDRWMLHVENTETPALVLDAHCSNKEAISALFDQSIRNTKCGLKVSRNTDVLVPEPPSPPPVPKK